MKFGKLFESKQTSQFIDWKKDGIEYNELKRHLKDKVRPNGLNFEENNSFNDDLQSLIDGRLMRLRPSITEFVSALDKQISRLNSFFIQQSNLLVERHSAITSKETKLSLLEDILRLEKFIFLNYTAISKILKKHDKFAGFSLRTVYLSRLSSLEFYKSHGIIDIKKSLLEHINKDKIHNSPMMFHKGGSSADITDQSNLPLVSLNDGMDLFPPAVLLSSQRVIISMSGNHGTDIIAAVLENMDLFGVTIEDMMFSRLYHNVTCAVLVRLNSKDLEIFHSLTLSAKKWDATLRFDTHDGNDKLPDLSDAPYKNRVKYTATILNQNGLSSTFLSKWIKLLLLHKISVESMKRLNQGTFSVLDVRLSVPIGSDFDTFRRELFELFLDFRAGTDVAIQPDDVFRRCKRLVVMDMDSTLIQQEVIDELAKYYGVVDQVAKITHSAMNGEIDFKESLKQRVGLLKGAPSNILTVVKEALVFTDGAHFLCKALKKLGYKLAVISGGFLPLANYVKNELGLDYAFANQLKVSDDGLTLLGETFGPIVDGERKAELLEVIAQAENINPEQVIAIGDGANDLFMLGAAGLGIAFNAKPTVQERARTRINQKSLINVLYLLGYSDENISQLTK